MFLNFDLDSLTVLANMTKIVVVLGDVFELKNRRSIQERIAAE